MFEPLPIDLLRAVTQLIDLWTPRKVEGGGISRNAHIWLGQDVISLLGNDEMEKFSNLKSKSVFSSAKEWEKLHPSVQCDPLVIDF